MKRTLFSALLCVCLFVSALGVFGAEPEIEIIPHEKSTSWIIPGTISSSRYTGKEFAVHTNNGWEISEDNLTFRKVDMPDGVSGDNLVWMNGVYLLFDSWPGIVPRLWDSTYDERHYTGPIYVLDENFQLINTFEYDGILVDYVIYDNEFHFTFIQQFQKINPPRADQGWKGIYCKTSDFKTLQMFDCEDKRTMKNLLPAVSDHNRFRMPVVYEDPLRFSEKGPNVYYTSDINQYSLDGVYFADYPNDILLRKRIWYANGYLYVNREECYEKMQVTWPEYTYVKVNGNILGFNQPPVMENDRTLVPMRFLFEQLGDTVVWDDQTQTVTAFNNTKVITIGIDDHTAYVNGEPITLDVPPRLINDQTFVPLRFLSENLGYSVTWDAENNMAIIETEVQK